MGNHTNNFAYWNQPTAETMRRLESSPNGLCNDIAMQRLSQIGPNVLTTKPKYSALGLFLNQFKSPIMLILLFATGLSAFLRDWTDALIILGIIVGSGLLSFLQEYNANSATEKLQAQIAFKTTVLRDGVAQTVPASTVVPGDVVVLTAGSLIPADGLLLEAKDLYVNQSVLTGETFPVEKAVGVVPLDAPLHQRTNTVFMGTNVRSGSGRVLIAQTGAATAFGQIAERLAVRPPETEFERGIRRLGFLLTEIMLLLVLGIFAVNVFFQKPVLDSLLFSLALAVGLTPQLLPAIININLAKGAQIMAQNGVIVRRLVSIENFGSMDILCTDKTGTLTVGVVQLDGALNVQGESSNDLLDAAYLNAALQTGLTNPLDEAIVAYCDGDGYQHPALHTWSKVDEIPYDFNRKRLTVIVQRQSEATSSAQVTAQPVAITKGALNNVLAICTHVASLEMTIPLDANQRTAIKERYAKWSSQGYRVLGVATRTMPIQSTYTQDDEAGMTFAGFLLFFDPPKADMPAILADLADLGVQLKIITGDNKLVAQHTAETIGVSITGVLTGAELDTIHTDALPARVEATNLFAEVDPNQKERIITALQKRGHVVGYMGDGINDAPSLHSADVGISVMEAVDVAKEAADFVLLEKDLAVLHRGIIEGRITFANTLKYIFMATSANFGNMVSMAGASLLLPFLPMLPKQILLLNFLTDLPEMAIAGDNVDQTWIDRPYRWDIGFIRRFMLTFGPLSSLFDFVTFGLLFWLHSHQQAAFQSGWFIESLVSATLIVFVLRTRIFFLRSRSSRAMLLVTGLAISATVALPYTPVAGLLGFTALPLSTLLILLGVVLCYVIVTEWVKQWFYQHSINR